jgi:hypothetical protein
LYRSVARSSALRGFGRTEYGFLFMKKCFFISPIGQPGSDVREQADAVLDYIIEPALKDMEIEAVRADKLTEPGLITDQVIGAILNYDLCIADLSGQNPNVFYELAIALAAERPVVLLKLAGEVIPFDVKDYRLIEYDLKPKSIRTDKWIPVLRDQVTCILAPDYKPPRLLGTKIISKSDGFRCYIDTRSEEFGDAPRFHEVVRQAAKYCCLMGISLKSWASEDGRRVLEDLAGRGISVRILIMDAENPGLAPMINTDLPSEDLEAVKRQNEKMREVFQDIEVKTGSTFQMRRLVAGLPHFQLMITDQTALVLQYMFSRTTAHSPLQQFPSGSQLHRAYLDEFDQLWKLNETTRCAHADSGHAAAPPNSP